MKTSGGFDGAMSARKRKRNNCETNCAGSETLDQKLIRTSSLSRWERSPGSTARGSGSEAMG
jgi:hypothetical protein